MTCCTLRSISFKWAIVVGNFNRSLENLQSDREQQKHDLKAYRNWNKKDPCAHFTRLTSMQNDLIGQFEAHTTAKEMQDCTPSRFFQYLYDQTTLTLGTFYSYKIDWKYSMVEHPRDMSGMICDLNTTNDVLIEEQQIQGVLRALPKFQDTMNLTITT